MHDQAKQAALRPQTVQIVGLHNVLMRLEPSPVVALNRAVAIATRDGPEAGLNLVESLHQGDVK